MTTNDDARSPHPDIHLAEIRALAQRFGPDELEACIRDQLEEGANVCEPSGRTQEIIGVLAKAEFVKALVEKGFHAARGHSRARAADAGGAAAR